jgi:hypothetical protein
MARSFSPNNTTANRVANMGDKYLRETAVPTGKYFNDIKKRLMAVNPKNDLSTNNPFLFPKILIPLIEIYEVAKTKEPSDLKKTTSKVGKWARYFTTAFIKVNEKVLIIIKRIAFFKSSL